MYQEMAMFMSAYELLKEVDLSEDAIKCLYMSGRQTLALEVAEEMLQKYQDSKDPKTANMICIIGDVKKDPRLYE